MATVSLFGSRSHTSTLAVGQGGQMRLYFDLLNGGTLMPDVHGVEVSDLDEAHRAALAMIRMLRQEDPSAAQDWSGWRLDAINPAGTVVFTIHLDRVVS